MGDRRSALWDFVEREEATGTGTGSPDDVKTSLASTDGDHRPGWAHGGGSGHLKSDKAVWAKASEDVRSLRRAIRKALAKLEQGQKGSAMADGVKSAASQVDLYSSWARYLGDVSGRCSTLQDRLEKAGSDHYKNDDALRDAFAKLGDRYEDTRRVGGQGGR